MTTCMGMAAQIAFYTMLGLFPFLIFLLSLVSTFPLGEALQAPDARSTQRPDAPGVGRIRGRHRAGAVARISARAC